ncbi:MAG: caspase family protein [bacterium]|nr:caspase family protein [bacterium]
MKGPSRLLLCFVIALPISVFGGGEDVASEGVRRYALIAGANFGGSDRAVLKYAVSDAQSFASVLVDLGGVEPSDYLLLEQPSLGELEDALDELRDMVAPSERSTPGPRRTEVVVYYSGHADEKGLLLAEDRYSYLSLRRRLDEIPADVRIAVLDACASGAITRIKGGRTRQAFLVDASSDMQGYAFLTSSSEDEGAQESDRIGASFFTHYLVSGLRGAADMSGEGKVTLNEAYQFAFNETLGRTAETRSGAQHPAYDINMTGTGDVVMTDLRGMSARLVLGEDLDGRCFVRNSQDQLVVELRKTAGRSVNLGLEPGKYEVRCDREVDSLLAEAILKEDQHVILTADNFTPTVLEAGTSRGGTAKMPALGQLENRHGLLLRLGVPMFEAAEGGGSRSSFGVDISFGVGYIHWFREDLAFLINFSILETGDVSEPLGTRSGVVWSVLSGLRHDFSVHSPKLKPFVSGTAGLYATTGDGVTYGPDANRVSGTRATIGGQVGGGLDVHLGHGGMLGVYAGYNIMANFSQPYGGRENFNGFELGITVTILKK